MYIYFITDTNIIHRYNNCVSVFKPKKNNRLESLNSDDVMNINKYFNYRDSCLLWFETA